MLCYFSTAHTAKDNPCPKSSEPSPSTPLVFPGSALLVQAISESTSHTFTCKKLWIPLEMRHGTKFPRTCWGGTVASHQCQCFRPAPEAVTHGKRAQWSCVGAKQHNSTRADICSLRWDPNKENLPNPPSFQQLRCFQGECWMQKTLGWGEWVATLRLNLVHTNCENLPLCLCG